MNQYSFNNEIGKTLGLVPSKKIEGEIKRGRDTNIVVVDQKKNLRGVYEKRNIWVSQDSQPFNEGAVAVNAENLVIVAGHSVTVSGHLQDAGSDESDWFLLEYYVCVCIFVFLCVRNISKCSDLESHFSHTPHLSFIQFSFR